VIGCVAGVIVSLTVAVMSPVPINVAIAVGNNIFFTFSNLGIKLDVYFDIMHFTSQLHLKVRVGVFFRGIGML
jgi:hypothetical protein